MAAPTDRYARQRILPGFGDTAQARLASAHVAIVGVGALGCCAAELLTRAGVGTITLIDRDVVDQSNLQRQCLFGEQDAIQGLPKVEAASARLQEIRHDVHIHAHAADATSSAIERLLGLELRVGERQHGRKSGPSVLVDGCDNFATRYLLNDVSVKHGIAYAYAGVVGTHAMQATFVPARWMNAADTLAVPLVRTPCLRCLFPVMPDAGSAPTCETAGVLGPSVHIAAAAQVADVLKLLTGNAHLLSRSLLRFDVWHNQRQRIALGEADASCACCGRGEFAFLASSDTDVASLCGSAGVQVMPIRVSQHDAVSSGVDLNALAVRLRQLGEVRRTRMMLRFTPTLQRAGERLQLSIFSDARAIIQGTLDPARARSVYDQYVGG